VRVSKLRQPLPQGVPELPNPIAAMEKEGKAEPVTVAKLVPPLQHNDGTAIHIHFQEAPGGRKHFVWVAARPDGRGAVNVTPAGAVSGVLVRELRPAVPFYFWVTYLDADGKMSRPSRPATAKLANTFSQQ
jgi:hypothetical protein